MVEEFCPLWWSHLLSMFALWFSSLFTAHILHCQWLNYVAFDRVTSVSLWALINFESLQWMVQRVVFTSVQGMSYFFFFLAKMIIVLESWVALFRMTVLNVRHSSPWPLAIKMKHILYYLPVLEYKVDLLLLWVPYRSTWLNVGDHIGDFGTHFL